MSETASIETAVVDVTGAEVGRVSLPAAFSAPIRDYLLFDQVLSQLAGRRGGTAHTKTRGEVRGGGKKPWKQKGTGRARAGSSRSPIWRGGGTTFGPRTRDYSYRLPRSARRAALASALAQKLRDAQLKVLDSIDLAAPRTKDLRQIIETVSTERGVLLVLAEPNINIELSARNLPDVKVVQVEGLNVYDILLHRNLIIAKDALARVEERLK